MEGLIPLVFHAIKKNRKRSKYRSLSESEASADDDGGVGLRREDMEELRYCRRPSSETHPSLAAARLRPGGSYSSPLPDRRRRSFPRPSFRSLKSAAPPETP